MFNKNVSVSLLLCFMEHKSVTYLLIALKAYETV